MPRMYWYGRIGYPTAQTRDQVYADFAAAAQPVVDAGTITPGTWEITPDVPAGLGKAEDVDGMPGVTIGYYAPVGWDSTDEYVQLYSIVQDPAEAGYQGVTTLL